MKMKSLTIQILLLAGALALFALAGCGGAEEEVTEVPAAQVVVQNPETGTITEWYNTTCELVSPLEANLTFVTGGRVVDLAVREGDVVVAGQYLGRVDTSTYSAQLSSIMSSVTAVQSQAEAADLAAQAAEAQVDLARAAADQAEADYLRFQSLVDDGVATQAEFEQVELAYDSALIRLAGARDQVDASWASAEAAHSQIDSVRSQAGQISEMIDDGTLRAPFGGRIAGRYADPGDIAGIGMHVFRLVGEGEDVGNQLELQLKVPEFLVSQVNVGATIYVDLTACDRIIQVPVNHLGPEVNETSRTVEVIAYVEKDSICLLPGMFGTAKIPLEIHDNAILVPEAGVLEFEDRAIVYIAEGDTAVEIEVTLGIREEGMLEIVDGLATSDQVIVIGNRFLRDGAKIEVRQETPEAGAHGDAAMEGEQ